MTKYRDFFYKSYVSIKTPSTNVDAEYNTHLTSTKPFFTKIIKKYFPAQLNSRIIDLGCGDGSLLYFSKQAGYQNIIGYDISPEQIKIAQSLNLQQIYLKEASQAIQETPNHSVDLIISFDVLEHMTKDEVVLFSQAVYSALKSNGKWIIHTLNAESPFFGRIRYGDFTHENGFTASSINQLLSLVGFKKIYCYEDTPICHGLKSTIRFFFWKVLRTMYRFFLAIETGEKNGIFSQNFLVVADKHV